MSPRVRRDAATLQVLDRIKTEMRVKGISQAKLAELTGIDQTGISRRLSGDCELTVGALFRIASAIGVEPGSLLSSDFTVSSVAPPRTITITVPAGAEVRMTS